MISEFPLFVFTTLAGLSGGAYVARAVFDSKDSEVGAKRAWLLPLVCLVLLGAGLLGCLGHLGRPLMFMNALANPTSMIAEEAYWSIAFGIVVLIDVALCLKKGACPRGLHIAGAVFACVLMAAMSNAYFSSHAVAAWTNLATWPMFIVGDLVMGFALYGAVATMAVEAKAVLPVAVFGVLFALAAAGEAFVFVAAGADAALIVVGAVLAALGAAVALATKKDKRTAVVVFVVLFAAVAIARYGFYAASIL